MAKNWALEFDSTDSNYITVPYDLSLNSFSKITLETYLYLNAYANYIYIFAREEAHPYFLRFKTYYSPSDYLLQFLIKEGGVSKGGTFDFAQEIQLQTWYHLVAQGNGSKLQMFLGGIKSATEYDYDGIIDGSITDLYLGRYSSYYLDGRLDETRISDTDRYSENFTPPTRKYSPDANTMALYHLDNNYLDSSGNGNHGIPSDPPPTFVYPGAPLIYGRPAPLGQNGLAGADMLRGLAL